MKLYVSDLDGTLLNDEQKINDKSVGILNDLIGRGLHFSIATARSLDSAWKIIKPLKLKMPFILHNGVFVHDTATSRNILSNFLDNGVSAEILDYLEQNGFSPFLFTSNENTGNKVFYKGIYNKGQEYYVDNRLANGDKRFHEVDNLKPFLDQKITTIVLIGDTGLDSAFHYLKGKYDLTFHYTIDIYTNDPWLEITHKKANKRDALQFLKNYTHADELIVFGDNLNDLPMFEISDYSYAVKNANEQVLKAATGVIESNTNDGVALFLEHLYRNKT